MGYRVLEEVGNRKKVGGSWRYRRQSLEAPPWGGQPLSEAGLRDASMEILGPWIWYWGVHPVWTPSMVWKRCHEDWAVAFHQSLTCMHRFA